jgi:hypothetical protein
MVVEEDDIRRLLEDPEQALRQWYVSVTPSKDPELVLTGGAGPSPRRIREIFNEWFSRRREDFREVICERLGYSQLGDSTKDMGEIALVAIVSSALAGSPWGSQIDPMATATILVTTRALNGLCVNESR